VSIRNCFLTMLISVMADTRELISPGAGVRIPPLPPKPRIESIWQQKVAFGRPSCVLAARGLSHPAYSPEERLRRTMPRRGNPVCSRLPVLSFASATTHALCSGKKIIIAS